MKLENINKLILAILLINLISITNLTQSAAAGSEPVSSCKEDIFTAIKRNNIARVKDLISNGIDLNITQAGYTGTWTPLDSAIYYQREEITQLLLESGADSNRKFKRGKAFDFCNTLKDMDYEPISTKYNTKNKVDTVSLAIDAVMLTAKLGGYVGSWVLNKKVQHDSSTPLHIACKYNQIDIIRQLLNAGANIDAQDTENNTPLIIAATANNTEVVALLMVHKADVKISNKNGQTAKKKVQEIKKNQAYAAYVAQHTIADLGIPLDVAGIITEYANNISLKDLPKTKQFEEEAKKAEQSAGCIVM